MALELRVRPSLRSAWSTPFVILGSAAGLIVLAGALGLRRSSFVQSFSIVFLSICFEALPFVILGGLVSALLETVARDRVGAFLAGLPVAVAVPVSGLLGFLFPVCECGSVPVARRLAKRGLHPAGALTYMLAGPVVNPIVILSTAVAFRGRAYMVWGRVTVAYVVAIIAAWVLAPDARRLFSTVADDACHDSAEHEETSCFGQVLIDDVIFMGRYLVVGAALAAGLQALIPRSALESLSGNLVIGILALMVFAVLVSICSEADAFVATSFTSFSPGALLGFMVLGPMVDLKLLTMYGGSFGARVTRRLVLAVAAPTLVGAIWFDAVVS